MGRKRPRENWQTPPQIWDPKNHTLETGRPRPGTKPPNTETGHSTARHWTWPPACPKGQGLWTRGDPGLQKEPQALSDITGHRFYTSLTRSRSWEPGRKAEFWKCRIADRRQIKSMSKLHQRGGGKTRLPHALSSQDWKDEEQRVRDNSKEPISQSGRNTRKTHRSANMHGPQAPKSDNSLQVCYETGDRRISEARKNGQIIQQ